MIFKNSFSKFANLQSTIINPALSNKALYNIVYRYVPQRNPFDKTNYIDDYVPRVTKYHKSRKPRQA
jgi:hypothetical protein